MKKLNFLHGNFSWNKIGKDRFLILLICGLLLLVIVIPAETFEKTDNSSKRQATETTDSLAGADQEAALFMEDDDIYSMNYTRIMESRLEEILSCIEGAGKVKVLVTIKQSEKKVVEKDNPNERKNVYETGEAGENKNTMELTNDVETIYTEDEAGHKVPFVTMQIVPKVEGVVVVAQGGGDENIKKQITEVIQALFDMEAHKIKVVKMKGENQ